ncbi:unnamed protein product [Cladocopium goreaui]|uniref:Ankyrin-1 n=2 Tax=Cladocopium goreaui TaxID=2562237 RepID=A0A9P1G6M1_9DINO|nr:unnamed protein product [Cladocopium goreaui]
MAYWCNRLAFYLYCVSMPLMGPVYNPSPPPAIPGLKHVALGYHMLIVGGMAAILDIFFAVRECVMKPTVPADDDEELSELDVEEVNQSMDSMGNRAVLMVGFIQHASARFIGLQHAPDGHEYELYLNHVFPLMVSLGCVCLQAVVYITFMSTTQLRTGPVSRSTTRCLFALFRISDFLFKLGVFVVLSGASLTGWGCSCPCCAGADYGTAVGPCAASLVPDGACYTRVAYVPMTCCFASILVIAFFLCWSRCAASHSNGEDDEDRGDLAVALDSLGTVGTLAAGFVMYNITTFNTDVIRGPFPAEDRPLFGLTNWGFLFLWANWLAFSMGLAVVACVQIINGRANALEPAGRKQYLAAVESMLLPIEFTTLVSLVSFVLAFGLLGIAKMLPPRLEGFIASSMLLVVLARQLQKIWGMQHVASSRANNSSSSIRVPPGPCVAVLQGKLDAITGPSMMFGGFAYNGISFLFRSGAVLGPTYVVGMAASFCSALYLTFTSAIIDFNLARLSPKAKEGFAAMLGETLIYARRSYALCLAMFMMAFTVMGYIKLWDYGSPLSEQGPLGWKYGILQLIGGLLGLLSLWRLRHTIRLEASRLNEAPKEGEGAMGSQGPSLCKVRQMLAHAKLGSSSTAFQVGNVFYEVLFSGVNLHDPAANFAYFGFAVTTLVLGSIALMISCELFFSIEELSDGLKCVLAERLTIHFRLIRILYMASLISWLCSMFFSSEVKYPELWWASFSWSCCGLVVLTGACVWMRSAMGFFSFSEMRSDSSLEEASDDS